MKSTTFTKFGKAYSDYVESKNNINQICVDMLKEICNRTEDKAINLSKMTNFLLDSGDGNIAFAYDGGNHPEYASNMYSAVEGFTLDNDTIVFTLEDSDYYEESRVLTDDLICLCDAIVDYENAGYELGVNDYESEE
jgi:uncharacterized phage-like protein YoqJ